MTLLLSLLAFAAMLGVAVWRLWGFVSQFRPVPTWRTRYAGKVDPMHLAVALDHACNLLYENRGWDMAALHATVNATTIVVMPTPSWTDGYGRKIAGDADGMIRVGSDLAALCHELAHLHEMRTTGTTDKSHATWQSNGTQRACDEFEAWVKR